MRILLVKTSSLGDVVHNLPVATDIMRRFAGAEIDWAVEESFAELPRLHPAIRRVIPVALRRWRKSLWSPATWREIGDFKRAIKADAYDAVIDTQGLLKSALIAREARGPRIGHDRGSAREPVAARFYDRQFAVPRALHAVQRNRLLAAEALGYVPSAEIDYGISARPLTADWLPQGDYAVLLTATSRAEKEWPEADWQTLGKALTAAGLHCVLPSGSARERERATRLAAGLGDCGIAAPALNLTELAGLLAGARVVIGVDTGLIHLAAALGRPAIALYCGSDPALTGVLAGNDAINLGATGAPPKADAVVCQALDSLRR
ncbi:MAG: lipopolysaccharide heptosyltransferase I [Zoogloeaceae bacterium]|nr:lipopolysaccharide heptosyltransferase I [Zoogloeaceae bacterium]